MKKWDQELERECQDYILKCYPDGVSEIQRKEIRQAFHAGGLTVLLSVMTLGELPDEEAVENLSSMHDSLFVLVSPSKNN